MQTTYKGDALHDLCRIAPAQTIQQHECDYHQNNIIHFDKTTAASPISRRGLEQSEHDAVRGTQYLPASAKSSIVNWIENLPLSPQNFTNMMRPAAKRKRSKSPDCNQNLLSVTDETNSTSYENKWSLYTDPSYTQQMKSKGSFAEDHPDGPLQEEIALCDELLTKSAPLPDDPLWTPKGISYLRTLLRDRSELRVCIDLHPRLVPSSEILQFLHPGEFTNLVEGHNDQWTDATLFHGKLPQPDRTKAFSQAAFSTEERDKLGLPPSCTSWCSIRSDWLFPYLTCEVKCGRAALNVADNANLNSMTIALRNVVKLFSRAGDTTTVHRRFLGFSISHDDGNVRIYGHYPHIRDDYVTYWRRTIREFSYCDENARELATTYTFVYNVDSIFASLHLNRLKDAIARLARPNMSVVESHSLSSTATSSYDENLASIHPPANNNPGCTITPLRQVTKAALIQQLEQQKQDSIQLLAEQQRQSKEQIARMEKYMAEQQRQSKEQMAEQQRQSKEQMAEQQRQSKEQMAEQQRQSKEQIARMEKYMAEQQRQNKEQVVFLEQQQKDLMQVLSEGVRKG